uniref:Saposin B-type domain-containing protein n=1 Tax=Panagrolaimus superbus TaxID=310955 RepID=A0A914YMA1_9BILA
MNQVFLVLAVFSVLFAVTLAIQKMPETKGLGCSLCKDFVKELEKEIDHGEGTIEEKANRVCNKICHNHHTLDKLCKEIIDKSLELIVKGIENHYVPEVTCKLAHLC